MTPSGPQATDLTGIWAGVYNYPGLSQPEHFDAVLFDRGGQFSGTIHETARLTGEPVELNALVEGSHAAGEVSFIKRYDGTGGWAHSVHYDGHLDATGTEISGRWRLAGTIGTFLMIRSRPAAEELAERRLAEIETLLK